MRRESFHSNSAAQTQQIAKCLAEALPPPRIYCLSGQLGAGKTVFARGLVRGYGCSHPVTSPTFALMNEYAPNIKHFDLYRLNTTEDLYNIGFFDNIDEGVCIIEWGERFVNEITSDKLVMVNLMYGEIEGERLINCEIFP